MSNFSQRLSELCCGDESGSGSAATSGEAERMWRETRTGILALVSPFLDFDVDFEPFGQAAE